MATERPFAPGKRNYVDLLNDLWAGGGMPRIRTDPLNPNSEGVKLTQDRLIVAEDNGYCADCSNSLTLTFHVGTVSEEFSMFVNCRAGTVTVNVGVSGHNFQDNTPSKTITAGNAAIISCDGTNFRIFRMAAN